jgi:hypothetical protein
VRRSSVALAPRRACADHLSVSASDGTPWQVSLQRTGGRVGSGIVAGLVCGALIGGGGGRVVMFVLRLTSDPALHGQRTDDGFVIGQLSRATLFLVLLTAVLGSMGGLVYLGVRTWIPSRWRSWLTGVVTAVVGGAIVVEPGGPDFSALTPRWLPVVSFVALTGLYGVAMSVVVERLLRRAVTREPRSTGWASLWPLAALVLGGLPGIVLLALLLAGWTLARKAPALVAAWRSRRTLWFGRGALVGVSGLSAADLVSNLGQVL